MTTSTSIIRATDKALRGLAFDVRRRVFIEEQAVPEDLELDAFDHAPQTLHIVALDNDGHAVGAARLRPYTGDGTGKVERVAVLMSQRGTGLGRRLMDCLETEAKNAGMQTLHLNAQTHARGFYERLGYQAEGELFYEAGIEHIAMQKKL